MRAFLLVVLFYAVHAFAPVPQASVTDAAKFIKGGLTASPVQSVKRRKPKRRIRRVVYRKPVTVWVYPDKIEVMSYAEFWAMERAKMKALAAWCVGRTIQALP